MKVNEIQTYKTFGTIQCVLDEDGRKCYNYTHTFFGQTSTEDTIKGAREMLEYDQEQAVKIRQAISVLSCRGYKVYKEIA
jgi:hypothetical protein